MRARRWAGSTARAFHLLYREMGCACCVLGIGGGLVLSSPESGTHHRVGRTRSATACRLLFGLTSVQQVGLVQAPGLLSRAALQWRGVRRNPLLTLGIPEGTTRVPCRTNGVDDTLSVPEAIVCENEHTQGAGWVDRSTCRLMQANLLAFFWAVDGDDGHPDHDPPTPNCPIADGQGPDCEQAGDQEENMVRPRRQPGLGDEISGKADHQCD
jgi:hypothetical protein